MEKQKDGIVPSSFRDPSGFLFYNNGQLYRHINSSYKKNYELLISSGLFEALVKNGLLIKHEEVATETSPFENAYKVIKPEGIFFVSYPYEWAFSQLKDAALLTLEVQKKALEHGMSLKDCSGYNVQFNNASPVFIDSLSFEEYVYGKPWVGYRQFCQHFLAPLALMSYADARLNQLLKVYVDGIPLDLASSLLPFKSRFSPGVFLHIYSHAKSQEYFKNTKPHPRNSSVSRSAFLALLEHLKLSVSRLHLKKRNSAWSGYYKDTNYSQEAFEHKKRIIASFIDQVKPAGVWDLGSNQAVFGKIASDKGIPVICFDMDPAVTEMNYLDCVKNKRTNLLPLTLDLINPSPAIGWAGSERMSLAGRAPVDLVLCLALIHHLVIANNLPLSKIASFLSEISNCLAIEFIQKEDSNVQKMLVSRENTAYCSQDEFEKEFSRFFSIVQAVPVVNARRTMYLMKKKNV